ncbi:carboxypeptidase-like regulatory domain-containing protein [Hymenobacter sp. ASUV-10]|uniref:Carboxypeptidase-like regulatory domain-containing protein n=1 Tax=Hymenobacter aranciens TaxID=3063996 RepID=A0ABT9BKE7_9BACT|nr:carboxypeptidase-like regulatory domain-containing protein [Hymenobacter sp. ASUV-10]MDO7877121.1 carboxypeptidase-like regulatory domain-containing protein [Hymenobacter sp. ASUV-10]
MLHTSTLLGAVLLSFGLTTAVLAQPNTHTIPTPARSHAKAADGHTISLRGQIVGPEGPLPGAIVALKGGTHSAITNSNGMFLLNVPAGAPLPAIVSFAGFEDEEITIDPNTQDATLRLTTAHPIKVKRKQSLKAYMKTAHKQARRESRALK